MSKSRNMERLAGEYKKADLENAAIEVGLGKILPQASDLEELVLGAILLEDKAINYVGGFLRAEHFYKISHQWIYSAMSNLFVSGNPIDLYTVRESLKSIGKLEDAGGLHYLAQMTNKIGSAANVEYHARIIVQKWISRELIATSYGIAREAYDESTSPLDLLKDSSEKYLAIQQNISGSKSKSVSDLVQELSNDLLIKRSLPEQQKWVTGIPSGIDRLDRVTLGWNKTDLIILAGNTSEGKTTTMLQGVLECGAAGIPVGVFSLEMSAKQLIQKLVSTMSGVSLTKIRTGDLNDSEYSCVNAAMDKLFKYPIYICDTPGLDVLEIKSISKIWKLKYDIQELNIDYLQLIRVGVENKRIQTREQEISFISGQLKELAKQLDVPVIALSQLSRANEKRSAKEKRPILSDLRDGGSIEQDADVVIFVFRPEKHGIDEYPGGRSTANITEFIVAKNRLGDLKTIFAKFLKSIGKFDGSLHNEIKGDVFPDQKDSREQKREEAPKKFQDDDFVPF